MDHVVASDHKFRHVNLAHRHLARLYHPDKAGEESHSLMLVINAIWSELLAFLRDPNAKHRYSPEEEKVLEPHEFHFFSDSFSCYSCKEEFPLEARRVKQDGYGIDYCKRCDPKQA